MKMDFCTLLTAARIHLGNQVNKCRGNVDMHLNFVFNV